MNIIVKMKFGSHLYGTSTPESDNDFKGVFLPTKEEILLNKIEKSDRTGTTKPDSVEKNTKDDVDIELYSLHYFIELALEGQTVALDMLHAPDEMILQTSDIWEDLRANKKLFYTKNLNSFVEYARGQAAKYGIKGSRLNAAKLMIDFLKVLPPDTKLRDVWDDIPKAEHIEIVEVDPNGFRQVQVCNRKMQESVKASYAYDMVKTFYDAYGNRAKMAASNKGVDWKAISHAFRAAFQLMELFVEDTITYPLHSAPYLKKIKNGEINYKEAAPKLEQMIDDIEILAKDSSYPDQPDTEYWDNWLIKTIEECYFNKPKIVIPNPATDPYNTMDAFKEEFGFVECQKCHELTDINRLKICIQCGKKVCPTCRFEKDNGEEICDSCLMENNLGGM